MGLFLRWLWDSRSGRLLLCLGCALAFLSANALAEELVKVDGALRKMFPAATDFKPRVIHLSPEQIRSIKEAAQITFGDRHASQITLYTAREKDRVIGYTFEDTVIGKWGPIHYLVGLDTQGIITQVIVLDYQEIRGRPIAKPRFLRQYKGKTVRDPLQLRKDIDGVTGATISSGSLTEGARKILYIYELIKPELEK